MGAAHMTMKIFRCKPFYSHWKSFFADDVVEKLESATTALLANWRDSKASSQNTRLSTTLPDLKRLLAHHAYIIGRTISDSSKPLSDMVLVEYGGGAGLQSLLARQLGVGTVVYNDIDHGMCELAEGIADELGLKADFYVCGDVDALVKLLEVHQIKADAITSYDVLEHIYDIDYFLERLNMICNRGAVMMLCSGANMFWYPFAKHAAKVQKQAETVGLEEYKVGAFLKERMNIVREFAPSLTEDEVQRLGICTRGLVSRDIVREVDRYLQSGQVPLLIEHPTNTCYPHTGYWFERSLNPYYLAEVLSFTGFDATVLAVPFEETGSLGNNLFRSALNFMIRMSSKHVGLYFSYAYSIHARYTGTSSVERHKQHMYAHSLSPAFYLVMLAYELVSLFRPRRSYYSSQFRQ
jgi:2-polyprenyl-3-methyl-5-hydroxy-6-metoxy-1,4-benzoquinol methylase